MICPLSDTKTYFYNLVKVSYIEHAYVKSHICHQYINKVIITIVTPFLSPPPPFPPLPPGDTETFRISLLNLKVFRREKNKEIVVFLSRFLIEYSNKLLPVDNYITPLLTN